MSSIERSLLWLTVLIFVTGMVYAAYNTSKRGDELQNGLATTTPGTATIVPEGWQLFEDAVRGFSVIHPHTYTVHRDHRYTALGPGRDILGVSFVIAASHATGTNLSADSYLSVEQLPAVSTTTCSAASFLDVPMATSTITENNVVYLVAESVGAGAGNRYEEKVYVLEDSTPCTAVRYLIHSTNLANYEPGTIREFDHSKLIAEFDEIRRSFTFK